MPRRTASRVWVALRPVLTGVVLVVGLAAVWEGYKAFGQRFDDRVPGLGWELPVATDDLAMPHVTDIVAAFFDPPRRGETEPLVVSLLRSAVATVGAAAAGLAIAFVVGFGLALLMLRFRVVREGLTPWIVISQTIPLVAIAPMVVIWGGQLDWPAWLVIATISAYLAFFPITVNSIRGLTSPDHASLELMETYASSHTQTLLFLRLPTALPHVFTGLRLAATAAVVGALVGELSAGTGRGIGSDLLTFSYFYTNGPEKLYVAVFVASLVGVLFVQVVAYLDRLLLRNRPRHD
jgi:NitT/TauT family transport system permease protein